MLFIKRIENQIIVQIKFLFKIINNQSSTIIVVSLTNISLFLLNIYIIMHIRRCSKQYILQNNYIIIVPFCHGLDIIIDFLF